MWHVDLKNYTCVGFGAEAVHFLLPLEADGGYAVRLVGARADQFCPRTCGLNALRGRKATSGARLLHDTHDEGFAHTCHVKSCKSRKIT